jgi:hypothetical protein
MKVVPQVMGVQSSNKGEMYDFDVFFYIINPLDTNKIALYSFDKYGSAKKNATEETFLGSLNFNTAERGSFKWDTFAGEKKTQVALVSSTNDSFTISVSSIKKKNHSVELTFEGKRPDWLAKDQIWPGEVVRYEIKDLTPDKSRR